MAGTFEDTLFHFCQLWAVKWIVYVYAHVDDHYNMDYCMRICVKTLIDGILFLGFLYMG